MVDRSPSPAPVTMQQMVWRRGKIIDTLAMDSLTSIYIVRGGFNHGMYAEWNDVSRFFNRKAGRGNAEKLSRDAGETNSSFLTRARQYLAREQNAEGIVAWCALSIRPLYCR